MLNLATGIAHKGYPVDLVLARAEGAYLPQVPEGVRLVDLKARRVLSRTRRRSQPISATSSLPHCCLRCSPTSWHCGHGA